MQKKINKCKRFISIAEQFNASAGNKFYTHTPWWPIKLCRDQHTRTHTHTNAIHYLHAMHTNLEFQCCFVVVVGLHMY